MTNLVGRREGGGTIDGDSEMLPPPSIKKNQIPSKKPAGNGDFFNLADFLFPYAFCYHNI